MTILKWDSGQKGVRVGILAGSVCLALAASAGAQAFSRADSGWVRIFNGQNFDGLYSRVYGATAPLVRPPAAPYQILYAGTDTAVIRVSATTPGGNIGTDKTSYSHYRVRVEYKFDRDNDGDNAGITYHTDETALRMNNNWPRSIECQMKQNETGSAFSIQQVTFNTRATSGNYSPTGTAVTVCQYGCNARQYYGRPYINPTPNGTTRWMRMQVVARGADSAIHIINDTAVMRISNIRIFNDSTQTGSNRTPNGPWDHGAFGLQSEGALLNYRRWEVMEFPAGTPMSEHFLHRLFLDNPNQGENLVPSSTYAVKWRSIGTIPKVFLQYNTGTGGWKNIAADSVNNTGSYNWVVPNELTSTLRLRVSGPAWAWADSSDGNNSIGTASGLRRSSKPELSFFVDGKGKLLSGIEAYSLLEIRDAFGKSVRNVQVGEKDLRWDLTDARGTRVQPGIYFLHFSGPGRAERTLRTLVF